MLLPIHRALRARIAAITQSLYGLDAAQLPTIAIGSPPNRRLGDLSITLAFELARTLRKAPRAIATEMAGALGPLEGAERVEVTPNGYLNVFLDRAAFLRLRLASPADIGSPGEASSVPRVKTIVEHTAINPNKAAHIGHLRNAALGDTLGRLLGYLDVPVEIQNYIDDTGVQVADVVVGFQHLENRDLASVMQLADATRFDYDCWDLYARVTEWYEADKTRLSYRADTLHAIEEGRSVTAKMGELIADRIVRCHLRTMGRMNVDYNLLTWESNILQLQFWATAFEQLKARGAVFLQQEGRLAGCWVMRIDDDAAAGESSAEPSSTETTATVDDAEEGESREKVIVRSNGTVTYVGKDIAYQFWKFGLLGKDFYYRPFAERLDRGVLWSTTATPVEERETPTFGRAGRTYNVIDTRQSYLQKLLKQALKTMGYVEESERATHFAYEMVALSHRTARQLGYQADGEDDRPFVEVSGRKGLGVKADDLLDQLVAKAREEVEQRNPDMPADERQRVAEGIAVAAVRYFLIKFSRGKIITFDIEEALAFEGETGPYLQYAVVRANNIFNKLREREGITEADVVGALEELSGRYFASPDEGDDVWDLVLECARLDEVVETAIRTLEPSVLAKFAFGLAQRFNAFYHRYPILGEENREARLWRAAVTVYFKRQLTSALELMGASVPARM